MKKIDFFNSAKLLTITIGLILGTFVMLSMALPEEGSGIGDNSTETTGGYPNDSTNTSRPKPHESHYQQSTCNKHGATDYAKAVAITTGGGTVTLSDGGGGGVVTNDGDTSGSENGDSVTFEWNCGSTADQSDTNTSATEDMHKHKVVFAATPDDNHSFVGWSKTSSEDDIVSKESPYTEEMFINDWNKNNGSHETAEEALTLTYYAIFKEKVMATITLAATEGGSYTYTCTDGNGVVSTQQQSITTQNAITFTAKPFDGYKFFGWYTMNGDHEEYFSYSSTLEKAFFANTTLYAKFIPADWALFSFKDGDGTLFYDLNKAIFVATNGSIIVVATDGTLPAGNYTIPQGVTLLIPYDNSNRMGKWSNTSDITLPQAWHGHADRQGNYKKEIETSYSTDGSFPYVTLKMAKDATIVVNGTLYLNAARWTTNDSGDHGRRYGTPSISGDYRIDQGYGLIDMEEGSSIEIGQTGKLYCWGRIRGEGTIEANNGAEVRECFVFTDHRESDAFACIAQNTKCFPMNQYYIQDIQVPITFNYGAKEILVSGIFSTNKSPVYDGTMNFIGANTDNNSSLIEIASNGSVTKQYNVIKDRLEFRFSNASFNNTYLSVTGFGTQSSTETHVFTITNNWTINVESDTTHIAHDIALAAGAELNISSGASVVVDKGASLYVMDKEDWGLFACHRKIIPLFLPSYEKEHFDYAGNGVTFVNKTWGNTSYDAIRTPDNLTSASIKVDGSLIVKGGTNTIYDSPKFGGELGDDKEQRKSGLYTSNNGAKIYSENDGIVIYEDGSGTQYSVPQLWGTGRGTDADWGSKCDSAQVIYVRITPAQLKNANGSYTETKDFTSETTFVYEDGTWIAKIETIDIEEATYTVPSGNKIEATDITIHEGATLDVATDASLTVTEALVIKASENNSGDLLAADKIEIADNVDVYFDYTFNTPAMWWNAIAFPWQVDAISGVKVGATALTLGRDFDIIYYDGATRAAQGPVDDCWKYVEDDDDKTLVPGRLYMILFAQPQTVVRFAKVAKAPLVNEEVKVAAYSGNSQDANWNGIANPALYHAYLGAGVDEGQVYNNADDSYSTITLASYSLPVGKPVFVQAKYEQPVVVSKEQPAGAPAYWAANENTSLRTEVELKNDNNVVTDKVILCMDEDALDKYTIGSDLAKAGVSSKVAQLWVNRYGTQLCKNTIAPIDDIADYPLTIFVPVSGEYTLVPNAITNSDYALYLTYAGAAFAELTEYGYTLELTKGNNSDYGLRLIKKQSGVVTSLDEALMLKDVQKVIYQGNLYIIRNKRIYNAAGQLIK